MDDLFKLGLGVLAISFLAKLSENSKPITVCPYCNEQIGKWAMACPNCRNNLGEQVPLIILLNKITVKTA